MEDQPSVGLGRKTLGQYEAKLISSEAKILIIYCGGTIGRLDRGSGFKNYENTLEQLLRNQQYFHDEEEYQYRLRTDHNFKESSMITPVSMYNKRVVYELIECKPLVDSRNMTKQSWIRIAKLLEQHYAFYDGFILLHGTDTMAYTASVLSFILEGLAKPVIVTGSQIPLCKMRNDAISNILGALTIAGHFQIPEVTLYFNEKLYRGNRVQKQSNLELDCFESPNWAPLAHVEIEIYVEWEKIRPPSRNPFSVFEDLDENIAQIRIHPLITGDSILQAGAPPTKAIIISSYGAGNIPDTRVEILDALKTLNDNGVVLINITQCERGSVDGAYAAGRILETCGVLSGSDIIKEAAISKLAYLLGKYPGDVGKVRQMFTQNLQGEITPQRGRQYGMKMDTPKKPKVYEEEEFINSIATSFDFKSHIEVATIAQALQPTIANAAARNNDTETLRKLYEQEGTLAFFDYEGNTPLHAAVLHAKVEVIKFLIDWEFDINTPNAQKQSPLFIAIKRKHFEISRFLIKHHAIVNAEDVELAKVLCQAAADNDIVTIKLIIEGKGQLNCKDHLNRNFKDIAVMLGRTKILSLIKTA